LHYETEYDDEVTYASSEDNIIIQDHKVAASDNEEAISNVADQEESVAEVKGITDDWTQLENMENPTEVTSSFGSSLRILLQQLLLRVPAAPVVGGLWVLSVQELAVAACWSGRSVLLFWTLFV
jgi:hypothetical protein